MFPDLFLLTGTKASMISWLWDTLFYSNTIMSYECTATMMTKQKIVPIIGWEDATKVLDQWMVILDVNLGPPKINTPLPTSSM